MEWYVRKYIQYNPSVSTTVHRLHLCCVPLRWSHLHSSLLHDVSHWKGKRLWAELNQKFVNLWWDWSNTDKHSCFSKRLIHRPESQMWSGVRQVSVRSPSGATLSTHHQLCGENQLLPHSTSSYWLIMELLPFSLMMKTIRCLLVKPVASGGSVNTTKCWQCTF